MGWLAIFLLQHTYSIKEATFKSNTVSSVALKTISFYIFVVDKIGTFNFLCQYFSWINFYIFLKSGYCQLGIRAKSLSVFKCRSVLPWYKWLLPSLVMLKLWIKAYARSVDLQVQVRGSLCIISCTLLLFLRSHKIDNRAKFSLKSKVDNWDVRPVTCHTMIFPNHSVHLKW